MRRKTTPKNKVILKKTTPKKKVATERRKEETVLTKIKNMFDDTAAKIKPLLPEANNVKQPD